MAKKLATTPPDPYISSVYAKESITEIFSLTLIVSYVITLAPLGFTFLCCLPSYLKAFKKNLTAHGASPFLPLLSHSFRTIRLNYPMLFIFGIAAGIFIAKGLGQFTAAFSLNMCSILTLAIVWYTSMYQLAVAIISIHRFINSRQPAEFRRSLSRKNVIILMVVVFLVVIARDLGCGIWFVIAVMMAEQYFMINTIVMYYMIIYASHQILLFIGMLFQFSIKEPATSHSEQVIATHTKWMGAVKLVLGVICFISYIANFQITLTSTLFVSIDFFLVPVIIEITEIRANPNIVAPEIQNIPLKV
ncbi:hypothetical protein GCK72_020790 [Caenorhabditis remanei]|uniref:Uncharacterized protein n=1 Tax=Caenorhabditis remanei TaxID=31234 RepID=A0A6A5GGG2_CAERE|nr:hypothetical protein GCK72_020790 [Caenorhabditis remanei]KAF1754230.1 hypothetical protein GCK72_020790 [Caenorhabditis remanei]